MKDVMWRGLADGAETVDGYWAERPSKLLREQGSNPFRGGEKIWWTPYAVIQAEESKLNESGTVYKLVLTVSEFVSGPFPTCEAAKEAFNSTADAVILDSIEDLKEGQDESED